MYEALRQKVKNSCRKGEFVLSSGLVLNSYFDVKELLGYPDVLNEISDELYGLFSEGVTCVASSGHGGLQIAAVIGSRHGLKICSVRREQKEYGMKKRIEYYRPGEKDFVAVVDDVMTTGKSLQETIDALFPAEIDACYVVVDRMGLEITHNVKSLFKESELL